MSGSRPLALGALLILACPPAPASETSASETTGSTTATSGTSSTPSSGTDASTGAPVTTSATDPDESTFLASPDLFPHNACDLWKEDCPEGQKCMPASLDGDSSWETWVCAPLDPDPDGLGEPCTVVGDGVRGEDSCGKHLMCWDFPRGEGTCIAFCVGSPDAPSCEPPGTYCAVAGDGTLALCLPGCDPLAQDCPDGDLCLAHPTDLDNFWCGSDVSGDEGQAFDPCDHRLKCDPGLQCVDPTLAVECDPMAPGCCLPFCDTTLVDQCPGQGQQCLPWFEPGAAPPGLEHVGSCALPMP